MDDSNLEEMIAEGHSYHFVGKVGQFVPIKPGHGGGILLREGKDGKFTSATGSKGFRWLESEMFKNFVETGEMSEDDIDIQYYRNLVDDAIASVNEYGDFEWFRSDDEYDGRDIPYAINEEELPFN